MVFISERIVNINELEKIIEKAHLECCVLEEEMKKAAPSKEIIDGTVNEMISLLNNAKEFEFCIEKRKCHFTEICENPIV